MAWSKTIHPHIFLLNKKVLEARSGKRMTLDLHAHAWILASPADCSIAGNRPKPAAVPVVHTAFTMTEKVEQHICIKLCQKLGHSYSETYDMILKASGTDTMGHTQVEEWFRWFKEGRMSVEGDERSGRPSTSRNQLTIDKMCSTMLDNQRITIRELSDKSELSLGSVVYSDRRFGHERYLTEICPKTADSQAERDSPCSSQRFAAVCWSRHKLHEDQIPAMNLRSTGMTQKERPSFIVMENSGVSRGQKRHANFRAR